MTTINYTKIDQTEVREELITLLRSTKTFKNANFSGTSLYDLANVLSFNASLFGFLLNQIANEPFIDTSKQYKNINRISNSLLYNPIGKGSAKLAIASKLSKDYVLRNTEGFVEIPTYSQFPSTKLSSDGENFAFTNEKPLVVQVQQFGVNFIKEVDIKYTGEINSLVLDPGQIVLSGQKKKPIQIVETNGIAIVTTDITSVAHDTLATFLVDTEYSITLQKVAGVYALVIRPKATTILTGEILRFKVNSSRNIVITQNFSQNNVYLGRLGFRNLASTRFDVVRQLGDVNSVGRIKFVIPRYSPAFEVLYNGEVFSYSDDTADVIISSEDLEQGVFEESDNINIVLFIGDANSRFFDSKLLLKKDSDLSSTDIVIGIIPATSVTNGNIITANESSFTTGETKSGSVEIFEGDVAKRVVFDKPYDFGLATKTIPTDSSKNFSIFIYADGNVKSFYSDKTIDGFIINIEEETGFTGTIFWKVVAYERTIAQETNIDISNLQGKFDTSMEYSVILQSGLNILTWTSDINESGFKIVSDASFVGDIDYLILPEKSFENAGNVKQTGTEFVPKGEVEIKVVFDRQMDNPEYQVFLQPDDNVNVWFENKTSEGFTIRVEEATDFFGKVDWQVYQSDFSGTVTFGGGNAFIDDIDVEYTDLSETSYLGFVTQGLVKMSQINEVGLLTPGVNGLNLIYDTDITINPGVSFIIDDDDISYSNVRIFSKIDGTWIEFEQIDNFRGELLPSSKVFYVRVNKDKKISIKFGNNDKRGFDPTNNKIVVMGMNTVGVDGNIGIGVLDAKIVGSLNFKTTDIVTSEVDATLIDLIKLKRDAFFKNDTTAFLLDYNGNEVSSTDLSVVQIGVGIFGSEVEDVESIRHNAQFSHQSQKRIVTTDDYKSVIKNQFSDFIIDVEVFNYKEANDVGLVPQDEDHRNFYNTLFFMMVPTFGTQFSLFQRETINIFLSDKAKKMTGVDTFISEPSFIPIDIIISFAHKVDASPIAIRNNITSGVYEYFKRANRALGETVTTNGVKDEIDPVDITDMSIMLKRDENNTYTAEDYDVDIKPSEFEDAFAEVEERKLQETIKKEIRNLVGKGLIELKQPLFDIQKPSGERSWLFSGSVSLGRFEFPVLGDLVIERKL